LQELRVPLLHAFVVPCEARRDRPDGRLLAERVELVRIAHRGTEVLDLLEKPEGPGLLDEGDLLRAPHRAQEGVRSRLEQCRAVGAGVGLTELRPGLLRDLYLGVELLQVRGELVPPAVALPVVL